MKITIEQAIDYEIRGSWFSGFAFNDFLQKIVLAFFVRKVRRKYKRYEWYYEMKDEDGI